MSLKMNINKKGSYVVEAAISLPIFLIAVMTMSTVILMFSCIENANFIAATEMRRAAIEAHFSPTGAAVSRRIIAGIEGTSSVVKGQRVVDMAYMTKRWDIDKLIAVKISMHMHVANPINIAANANYDVSFVTRAYVGKKNKKSPMSDAEMGNENANSVFIFPKLGRKYHNSKCTYKNSIFHKSRLTNEIRSRYKGCAICKSKNAVDGAIVYYFPSTGESYHIGTCRTLTKQYIEMERRIAIRRGYKPCSKCGG